LGFSKTVVTQYLAPEAAPEHLPKARRGAQPGRPSVRLIKRNFDTGSPLIIVDPDSAVGAMAGR